MILLEQDLPVCRPKGGPAARLLVVCDDPVLLAGVVKAILWSRPRYCVEHATTREDARRALESRAFDVVLACCDKSDSAAIAALHVARLERPAVTRIAYASDEGWSDLELRRAHEIVPARGDLRTLLAAVDAAVECGALDDSQTRSA